MSYQQSANGEKLYPNAGQPWENWEDRKVLYLYGADAVRSGEIPHSRLTLDQIAKRHGRTQGAITSRLSMLLGIPAWELKFKALTTDGLDIYKTAYDRIWGPAALRVASATETALKDAATFGIGSFRATYVPPTQAFYGDCKVDKPAKNLQERIAAVEEAICPRVAARLAKIEKLLGIES